MLYLKHPFTANQILRWVISYGTKVHVRLAIKALNSSAIAARQRGSLTAVEKQVGSVSEMEKTRERISLGFLRPARRRMTIGCFEETEQGTDREVDSEIGTGEEEQEGEEDDEERTGESGVEEKEEADTGKEKKFAFSYKEEMRLSPGIPTLNRQQVCFL